MNSGNLIQALFHNSADAMYIIAIEGTILEANEEAVRRQKFSRDELLTMKLNELDSFPFSELASAHLARIQAEGSLTFESEHQIKGGGSVPVEVNACLTVLDSRQVVVAVARDLTIRKSIEATLQRQNDYLNALNETTLGLINRLDIQSLLVAIISRAATLMHTEHGYIYLLNNFRDAMFIQVQLGVFTTFEHHPLQRGEGIAGHVWEIEHSCRIDDYSRWEHRIPDPCRDVLRAMAGVPLVSGDKVVGVIGLAYVDEQNRFDDEKMWYLNRAAELASLALDNARLYEASRRELQERLHAEESLKKLTYAVEQSPVSIIITDIQGNMEYVNPHLCTLTGYTEKELLGQNPRMLKSGFTTADEYQRMWETLLAGGQWRGEFYNRKKNGDFFWEHALISPISDHTGNVTNFIAIKEDITERKQLENQLRHSQKMEAIGQLAGGIAHDFNNILTGIIGYATILQMKLDSESPFQTLVAQTIATASRGAKLTQGLLAFSRKQVTNPVPIELNGVIERIKNLMQRMIGEEMQLITELSPYPLTILADSVQLEQVVMNLTTNARDAMPDGGVITIQTEARQMDNDFIVIHGFGEKGRYAVLTVADTGVGMDQESIKKIFEPFYTTKDTGKGTGLGLAIVYGIVKKHKGFIDCHSLPGMGTIFHVYFPLIEQAEESPAEVLDSVAIRNGSETILLAEDDATIRELTAELLVEFGYRVLVAEDGVKAWELYQEHQREIRLVILDAVMPGMKGYEVCQKIRKSGGTVPVLFCSGYPADFESEHTVDSRVHFIAKPFVPKQMLMKIREVLEHGE